jgi:hypothetical protein
MSILPRRIRGKFDPGYDNLPEIDGVSHYTAGTLCLQVLYDVLFTKDNKALCEMACALWGDIRVNGSTRRFLSSTGELLDADTLCSFLKEENGPIDCKGKLPSLDGTEKVETSTEGFRV